jgi:hypothetical protein
MCLILSKYLFFKNNVLKKRLSGFYKLLKIIGGVCVVLGLLFFCIYKNVQGKIIAHDPIIAATDTVIVHFIHGSIVQANCIYARPRLGGLLGGHVELEVSEKVYGFRQKTFPIHIFSKDNAPNSVFEVWTKMAWLKRTQYEKMTAVVLPINAEQKRVLQTILDNYLQKTPYDYAFFGKRCTSSTVEILTQARILPPLSNFDIMTAYLSPHPLRYTLVRLAEAKNYRILFQKGVDCRFWE